MSWPLDPIAAVTHPDPYPYYALLVAQSPLYFDQQLKMWIASGASSVKAVHASIDRVAANGIGNETFSLSTFCEYPHCFIS